jgi:glycerol-3-phosphate dehydrogenase
LNIAVIGGGINGLCIAWLLAEHGITVALYEKNELLSETSSASTKLLHGGLRYLEQGSFKLVYEALHERAWWLENAPQVTNRLAIFLPVYKDMNRSRWKIKLGLWLYDRLAGKYGIGKHQWVDIETVNERFPGIKSKGLLGGYQFYDGQMQDVELGNWVVDKVRELGVYISTHTEVSQCHLDGTLKFATGEIRQYDFLVNVTGPWAEKLLQDSGISSPINLDLVRGSHIFLRDTISTGLMLEHPEDGRAVFILPYQDKTLVGTTEVRQSLNDNIHCSDEEKKYLLNAYNHIFTNKKSERDICGEFSGIRPLLKSSKDSNKASREYYVERNDKLINVWGGKWTTARSLARHVVDVMKINRKRSNALCV